MPPGWVAQEALRLELYRRISLAPDHVSLGQIRTETVDRFGALPDEVETLFAIASLRVTARALGVEEISTFRDQVRLKPVEIADPLPTDLEERVYGATYRPSRRRSTSYPNASSAPTSWRSSSAGCWRRRPAARRCPKRLLPPARDRPLRDVRVTAAVRHRALARVDWSLVNPRTLRLVALLRGRRVAARCLQRAVPPRPRPSVGPTSPTSSSPRSEAVHLPRHVESAARAAAPPPTARPRTPSATASRSAT